MFIPPTDKTKLVLTFMAAWGGVSAASLIDKVLESNIYNGVIDGHAEGPGALAAQAVLLGDSAEWIKQLS